jgi:type III secretory pathway component EscV
MESDTLIMVSLGVLIFIIIVFLVSQDSDQQLKKSDQQQKISDQQQRIKDDKEARNSQQRAKQDAIKDSLATAATKAKKDAAEKLELNLSVLKTNLPFYTSNRTPSTELAEHDKNMWGEVINLIKNEESEKTTLYFVKLKSLMDDQEYFKIGITTTGVETRFKKSTQLELLEIIKVFDTEKWKAAFLEYHFLREFRLYDGLSTSIGEQRPEVGFSGYTEVVRSNSVNKISEYFGELDVYNKLK